MKRLIPLVIVMTCLCFVGCGSLNNENITSVDACYVFDVYDTSACVDRATDVFVAEIISEIETVYPFENFPYTKYEVLVKDTLKGELVVGESLIIFKEGGKSSDGNTIYLTTDDQLPEEGRSYILLGTRYGQMENNILSEAMTIPTPTMVVELKSNVIETIKKSDIYETYSDAVNN